MFVQSLFIGVSIAAPVGPIGLLVIQRTLSRGAWIGLVTGLGAAAADAVYGAIGAFGVTGLISWLQSMRWPLAIGGGAFLLWLAWRSWTAPVATTAAHVTERRGAGEALSAFAGTFVLTMSNPATIFSFIAIFGTLGANTAAPASPWPMIAGVLIGSALWWFFLAGLISRLRERFDAAWQRRVNRASAVLLAGFALWPFLRALLD